ncbi:MAG: phospho-N-acetylmuramoyl-pentapeptide-transferase [Eubacteriales bacterium]
MKFEMFCYFAICVVAVFTLTVIALRLLIPKLKSIKMGQKILDIGPRWHKSKEGTPTMGGISFIAASLLVLAGVLVFALVTDAAIEWHKLLICLGFAFLNGVIGFLDDFAKFFKKQNKGLSAGQKYLLQLIVAGAFLAGLKYIGAISTVLNIPFIGWQWNLGWFYYVFMLILITGIVNSVNLTDGIDGLCSSVTFVAAAFFAVAAFYLSSLSTAICSALVIGGTLGFLVYNFHPAKIFMGDTGSLFLGGMIVALAVLINQPLLLFLVGFVYICESFSDIIQVGYYKLTHGKRFFKMAPIHHHFEQCGWSENQIVFRFSLITAIGCVLAFIGLVLTY